ncbi:MAG: tetratricopeptide repeat protein, partial [Nitrospinota bacterium]
MDKKKVPSFPGLTHALIILTLSLIVYSNSFNGPFLFDDKRNIFDNPVVKDLSCYNLFEAVSGTTQNPCKPPKNRITVLFTFALNYQLNDLNPGGYHVVNLLIHMTTGLLLYAFTVLLFTTPALKTSSLSKHRRQLALFSALLFVAHPVQTQAVTYIVQRFASLTALLYLLTLLLYARARLLYCYTDSSMSPAGRFRGVHVSVLYVAAFFTTCLAMTSKEIAFTLPFMILLTEFIFFKGPLKKRAAWVFPFQMTLSIIPIIHFGASSTGAPLSDRVEQASKIVTEISRIDYLLTEFRVIVSYLRLLLFPTNQNLDYDYPLYHTFFTLPVFTSFCVLIFLLSLGIFFLIQAKRREGAFTLAGFGIIWFFVTLSVESTVIPLHVIFEHRLYLPSIGLILSAVTVLFILFEITNRQRYFFYGKISIGTILISLSILTFHRNQVWNSSLALWRDVVRKSPAKERGYTNLGIAYEKIGAIDKAIMYHLRAYELHPENPEVNLNLGNDFSQKGDLMQAIMYYEKALHLLPAYPEAWNNLGLTFEKKGDFDRAIESYTKAIKLNPRLVGPYINTGNILLRQNKTEQAIVFYNQALTKVPDHLEGLINLGLAKRRLGRFKEAVAA